MCLVAAFLVALAADGASVGVVVCSTFGCWDDVVWFGAVGLSADLVVELCAAAWDGAVCYSCRLVSTEYALAEPEVFGGACPGCCHYPPPVFAAFPLAVRHCTQGLPRFRSAHHFGYRLCSVHAGSVLT